LVDDRDGLAMLTEEIVGCRACPRLVRWREAVAADPRAAFRGQDYWARPLPGFGDPDARVLLVGLAPAAHGGNRTGRIFTGDRSGDWLFGALYRTGFANQPTSVARDDGLSLQDAYVSAAVRCAPPDNRPTPAERDRCLPYLRREISLLPRLSVMVVLGQFAYQVCAGILGVRPRPRFAHLAEVRSGSSGPWLLCSYHPSQQNTFTGRLTEPMLDAVFNRARQLAETGA
jgi:uracil-DNA glycosylase